MTNINDAQLVVILKGKDRKIANLKADIDRLVEFIASQECFKDLPKADLPEGSWEWPE